MKSTLACLVLAAAAAGPVEANGRAPATNGVVPHPDPNTLLVRSTFGLLISHDDGCSFRWICEQEIGYGGIYDPHYAVAADGTIFATTFQGLRVSRDGGCTFETATADLGEVWVDALDLSSTGDVWIATAEGGPTGGVYRSTDNGRTFASAGLTSTTILWRSLAAAPSDPAVVYVAGYALQNPSPQAHLFATTNAGASWDELPLTDLAFAPTPSIRIAAIHPTDARTFYVVSVDANGPGADRLYRTTDGGQAFAGVLDTTTSITGVVIDAAGVTVATGEGGTFRAPDGTTFAPLAGAPRLACLGKRSDGSFLGCATNWDPDFMAVTRSSDLSRWDKVFRFVDLAGPVECPAQNTCTEAWPMLKAQFGANGPSCGVSDAPAPSDSGGCCDAGARPSWGWLYAGAVFAWLIGRSRRGRSSAACRRCPR